MTTDSEIGAARADIEHGCDGPITDFVMIGRAMRLAANAAHSTEALSNALWLALEGRGYLRDADAEIPGT